GGRGPARGGAGPPRAPVQRDEGGRGSLHAPQHAATAARPGGGGAAAAARREPHRRGGRTDHHALAQRGLTKAPDPSASGPARTRVQLRTGSRSSISSASPATPAAPSTDSTSTASSSPRDGRYFGSNAAMISATTDAPAAAPMTIWNAASVGSSSPPSS